MRLPHLHPDAVRVEVDCRFSTTGVTSVPGGPVELSRRQLVTFATYQHEERCGRCDTDAAHRQGDQTMRAEAERLHHEIELRRAVAGRKN